MMLVRVLNSNSNHHLNLNTPAAITSTPVYDKASNITSTTTNFIHNGSNTYNIINTNLIDHVGRAYENKFQFGSNGETTLSKLIYNHREEVITKYQGKTGLSGVNEYLQEINFVYNTNGLLEQGLIRVILLVTQGIHLALYQLQLLTLPTMPKIYFTWNYTMIIH